MSDNERMTPFLAFPFNGFLKLRLEFALLTGDVMQALLLRIIENRVDAQRKKLYQARLNAIGRTVPDDVVLDIPTDIWVPISHAAFLYELYGLIKTEATLRKVLTALCDKQLIFTRKGPGRYDPTEYQLNRERMTTELTRMRERGKAGYQPLIPSEIDTFMAAAESQTLLPSEGQKLIPSPAYRVAESDPLRVAEIDTSNRKITEELLQEAAEESATGSAEQVAPNTAAAISEWGMLSPDEITLIQAFRENYQHNRQVDIREPEPAEATAYAFSGVGVPPAQVTDEQTGSSLCPDEPDPPSSQDKPKISTADEAIDSCVQSDKAENRPTASSNNPYGAALCHGAAIHSTSCVSTSTAAPLPAEQAESPLFRNQPAPESPPMQSTTEPVLTSETVVALFERKRGTHYDAVTRSRQLAAARTLLDLALPLDLGKLERVFDAYHDDWWVAHYGDLHVSHLVEREKSGEIRIVRWLARMAPPARIAVTTASFPPKLAPLPHLLSLHPQIPLLASGGMQPDVAQSLYEELRRDMRLALCKLALVPLADGTVALLVDYTVTSVVRQVAFYSPQQWQAKAATLTRCLDLFAPSDGAPALSTSERVAQLAQMMQVRKGSNLYA